jgi:hypothetical protein
VLVLYMLKSVDDARNKDWGCRMLGRLENPDWATV